MHQFNKWVFILLFLALSSVNLSYANEKMTLGDLRLNELQYLGTHNSYHIAPEQIVSQMLVKFDYGRGKKWDAAALNDALAYTHVPLDIQLALGLRTFELDIHDDEQGGRYANPGIVKVYKKNGINSNIPYDRHGQMQQPGFKVLHNADYDYRSNCKRLITCLSLIKSWSDAHPRHIPIIIQVEPKSGSKQAITPDYDPKVSPEFDLETFMRLEAEILSVFSRTDILTPDDVRGPFNTLREALNKQGWPKLKEIAGKVMFILIHPDEATMRYVGPTQSLKNKLMFANLWEQNAGSSFVIYNNPQKKKHISALKQAAKQNLLTYTRADANSAEARAFNYARFKAAVKTGANLISTDFPFPDNRISNYSVEFTGGVYVQCNAVVAKEKCSKLQ